MPEGLMTADGEQVEVSVQDTERQFAAAMAATPGDAQDPPKRQSTGSPERPQARRSRPPKAERSRVSQPKQPTAKDSAQLDSQRSEGIKGLVQMGAGLCLLMDSRSPEQDISWRADAVTLATSADAIAGAFVETAKHNSSFAAALDKVTQAGPYAALVSVTLGVGAQIARNHGVKLGEALGAKAPEDVLRSIEPETEQEFQQAA